VFISFSNLKYFPFHFLIKNVESSEETASRISIVCELSEVISIALFKYIYIFKKKKKKKQRVEEQENANPCLINEIEIADRALLPYHFGVKWRTYQLVQGVLCP
jgi:nitric oxide reductase large subunit